MPKLKQHSVVQKSYQCEFCHVKCRRPQDLRRHLFVHTEASFQCDRCGNKFTRYDTLMRHKRDNCRNSQHSSAEVMAKTDVTSNRSESPKGYNGYSFDVRSPPVVFSPEQIAIKPTPLHPIDISPRLPQAIPYAPQQWPPPPVAVSSPIAYSPTISSPVSSPAPIPAYAPVVVAHPRLSPSPGAPAAFYHPYYEPPGAGTRPLATPSFVPPSTQPLDTPNELPKLQDPNINETHIKRDNALQPLEPNPIRPNVEGIVTPFQASRRHSGP